jgi:hypothetical protein
VVIYAVGKIQIDGNNEIDPDDLNAKDYGSELVANDDYIYLENSGDRDNNPNDLSGLGCELTTDIYVQGLGLAGFINQGSAKNLELYSETQRDIDINKGLISAFMHFPNATVNVNGGLIRGVAWADTFNFDNDEGCTMGMVQNDVGRVVAAGIEDFVPINGVHPISSWGRRSR